MIKRRESEHSRDSAPDMIGNRRFKKGAVAAIMKNDERPHQDGAGQHGERDREPPRNGNGEIHEHPNPDEGNEGIHELPDRTANGRLLISGHDLFPIRGVGSMVAAGQI